MKVSQDLFELIKSLTPAEKRYFKVFAKHHVKGKENNYVLLFNAIDKQKVYNEAKLLKKLQTERLVRHFSSEKNYLYKLILKTMNAYRVEHNTKAQIRSQLESVHLLFDKRLIQQGFQQLKKTKKTAVKNEAYLLLLEILDLEINFAHQFPKEKAREIRQKNFQEKQELLELLRHSDEYRQIYFQVISLSRQQMTHIQSSQRTQLEKLLQSPILQENLYPNSLKISHLYYSIHKIGNDLLGNSMKAYQNAEALLNSWEQHPLLQSENKQVYLITLQNYIVSCYLAKQWNKIKETIVKIRSIPTRSLNETISIFEISYNAESVYLFEQKDFEGVHRLHQEVQVKLQEYQKHLKIKVILLWHFNFAQFDFFVRNQPESALTHLQNYLSLIGDAQKNKLLRLDIHRKALILQLLIHLELKNTLLLSSLLRNTKRYFQLNFDNYLFEQRAIQLIKELIVLPPSSNQQTAQSLFSNCLQDFQVMNQEKGVELFDYFITWLESKIKKTTVLDILNQKK